MSKINFILLLAVTLSLGVRAKPSKRFEVGLQLLQTEQTPRQSPWHGTRTFTFKSPLYSTNQGYDDWNYFHVPNAKGNSIHAAVYVRAQLWKRVWLQYRPEFFFNSITTEKPFAPPTEGTYSLSYNRYDKKVMGTNQVVGLQYQWVQKKKLWIYSGVELGYSLRKVKDSSQGYSWGCFGGGPLTPINGMQRGFSIASFTTGASYVIGHGFGLSILTGINVLQSNSYQSLSITKRF